MTTIAQDPLIVHRQINNNIEIYKASDGSLYSPLKLLWLSSYRSIVIYDGNGQEVFFADVKPRWQAIRDEQPKRKSRYKRRSSSRCTSRSRRIIKDPWLTTRPTINSISTASQAVNRQGAAMAELVSRINQGSNL